MKTKDQQLLEEAYIGINEANIQSSMRLLKGPIEKTVVIKDYYIDFNGTEYLYRVSEEKGKKAKEELFIGFGGNKPTPTPGSNVAQSPSHAKILRMARQVSKQEQADFHNYMTKIQDRATSVDPDYE